MNEKQANLAEELKRLNDILESNRGGALAELSNILSCGGISAMIALTAALEEHTKVLKIQNEVLSEHTAALQSSNRSMAEHAEELRHHANTMYELKYGSY